jgi:hypothetical protein
MKRILAFVFAVGCASSGMDSGTSYDVPILGDFNQDTGFQPAQGPAQVQMIAKAGGTAHVAVPKTDAEMGKLALDGAFDFQVNLNIDLAGVKYNGPLKSAPKINLSFKGEQPFST